MAGNKGIVELVDDVAVAIPVITNSCCKPAGANIPEVSSSFGIREYTDLLRAGRMIEALRLPIEEEEQLVLHNRAADRSAEHVPPKLILGKCSGWPIKSVLPLVRVQLVVAEEFPEIAVERVRSGFDGGIDNAPLVVSELRRRVLGDEIELFDGIRRWREAHQIIGDLVVVDAVENEIVSLLAVPVDIGAPAARRVIAVIEAVRIRRDRTRS